MSHFINVKKNQSVRALCVDYSTSNQAILTNILEGLGFNTETASTAREAVEKIKGKQFELIMVNLRMADMDGLELVQRLREAEGFVEDSRIIGITSTRVQRERDLFLDNGVDRLLIRPFGRPDVVEILDNKSAEPDVAEDPNQYRLSDAGEQVIDAHVIAQLAREISPRHAAEAIDMFRNELAVQTTAIQKHLGTGSRVEIAFQAHPIKSVAKTVGANELAQAAEDLETACRMGSERIELHRLNVLLQKCARRWVRSIDSIDWASFAYQISKG